jgi:hypothetical protein
LILFSRTGRLTFPACASHGRRTPLGRLIVCLLVRRSLRPYRPALSSSKDAASASAVTRPRHNGNDFCLLFSPPRSSFHSSYILPLHLRSGHRRWLGPPHQYTQRSSTRSGDDIAYSGALFLCFLHTEQVQAFMGTPSELDDRPSGR